MRKRTSTNLKRAEQYGIADHRIREFEFTLQDSNRQKKISGRTGEDKP
jgi:hypothetical protein